jgi:hypothetical protein
MQGEVPIYEPSNPFDPANLTNCDGSPKTVPAGAVQGFNSSTLSGRQLPDGSAGVIFRPWSDPVNLPYPYLNNYSSPTCYGFPQTLQLTFLPTP